MKQMVIALCENNETKTIKKIHIYFFQFHFSLSTICLTSNLLAMYAADLRVGCFSNFTYFLFFSFTDVVDFLQVARGVFGCVANSQIKTNWRHMAEK